MSEQSAAWEYKEESPLREAWKMYLQNRAAVLGLVLLGAVLLLTCVGPLVYPVDPFEMVAPPMSAPGEYGLICGSDYLGRDIFAGIIAGGKATMAVGGFATLVTLCIGITIGALAGYRQGIWDELLMRATEFFQVLPPLLLAMVVVALFSPSLTSVAVSIGIVSWPQVARVTRAEFMRIKEMDYVAAARTMGAGNATIMCRVILPNAIPPLVIVATLTISSAILFESGLSFLGLGDPNIMTWGMIIGSNKDYIMNSWWAVTFPGLAIFLVVLALFMINESDKIIIQRIVQRIKSLRKERSMSQRELMFRSDVNIFILEQAKQDIKIGTLIKITRALNISLSDFLKGIEDDTNIE